MKFSTSAILILTCASTEAFAPMSRPAFTRFSATEIFSSAPSLTEKELAVQEAMKATEEFGADSPQARVAWDTVNDLEVAAENENALHLEPVEMSSLQADELQRQLYEKLAQMNLIFKEQGPRAEMMEKVLEEVKAIKLPSPGTAGKATVDDMLSSSINSALEQTLKNAKEAEQQFGADSAEAKVAWSEVEQVASASRHSASSGNVYSAEECLLPEDVFSATTCEALAELERFSKTSG